MLSRNEREKQKAINPLNLCASHFNDTGEEGTRDRPGSFVKEYLTD